ncbi:hypothetical protein [Actinomadura sp. SCN-SB]|uniref:hypothetical protein n=1 Tax=Actinomadura sp. SCN-SB TaxID=3373092 RepID=UPI003753B545
MGAWFTREIVDTGRLRLLVFLIAFIAAFVFIRFSVRMIRRGVRWWPGDIAPGGHHIHHVVFGLGLMCVGGVGGLLPRDDTSAMAAALAGVFGAGTALVLDEFALVLHLQDVYWSEQGRLSVEVVFIAIALCGLALLGLRPLGIGDERGETLATWGSVVTLLFNLVATLFALAKGKLWTGVIGVFIGLVALVGAVRLARPGSPWARRRYDEHKLARAAARDRRLRQPVQRVGSALADLIAGRPTQGR